MHSLGGSGPCWYESRCIPAVGHFAIELFLISEVPMEQRLGWVNAVHAARVGIDQGLSYLCRFTSLIKNTPLP